MKAEYVGLIDLILSKGHRIDVDTGGDEPDVRLSNNRAEILMAIESVDMAELEAYEQRSEGMIKGTYWYPVFWAQIIPFGVEPDCTVVDFTDNGYYMEVV